MTDSARSKFFAFFGFRKNLVVILGVVFFVELGEKMGERFLPIYIIALGGSATVVGLSNALDNFLGALYSLPGGYLSDRIGYKKSLIFFNIASMAGYLIAILFPTWQAALLGAILFTSWSSVSLPAIMSAISKVLPEEKRTMGVTMHSLASIAQMGTVVGVFENEPANINALHEAFPEAVAIFLDTIHSPKPDVPAQGISWVKDFKYDSDEVRSSEAQLELASGLL